MSISSSEDQWMCEESDWLCWCSRVPGPLQMSTVRPLATTSVIWGSRVRVRRESPINCLHGPGLRALGRRGGVRVGGCNAMLDLFCIPQKPVPHIYPQRNWLAVGLKTSCHELLKQQQQKHNFIHHCIKLSVLASFQQGPHSVWLLPGISLTSTICPDIISFYF